MRAFIHLDGDKKNFTPENLFSCNLEELKVFHRKKYERLTPEQTRTRLLEIRLELKVKEMQKALREKGDKSQ